MTAENRPRPGRQRGAVLLLVLLTILFTAGVMTAFIHRAGTEIGADRRAQVLGQLRREACSGVEMLLAVLADTQAREGRILLENQRWAAPFACAGLELPRNLLITFAFEDETDRLSLPECDPDTLARLLAALGIAPAPAERAARALHAWMQPDPEAAGSASSTPSPAFRPAGRALGSFAELRAFGETSALFFNEEGIPNATYRRFIRCVSLHRFADTNPGSPITAVRQALQIASAAQPNRTGNTPPRPLHLLRARITAERGGIHHAVQVVIDLTAAPSGPLQRFGAVVEVDQDESNNLPDDPGPAA